jgi:hypothetical protein
VLRHSGPQHIRQSERCAASRRLTTRRHTLAATSCEG